MKASDLFVKALENEGVQYIFGIPGEENLDFLESLRSSSIRLVLTRHEQAAAFMAAAYGRLTGQPGVCLATLGPGATNLVTGAAYAQLGAMPLVLITGQKPIKRSKQGRFQIVDVVEMMRPITKYTKQVVNSQNIAAVVREAFRLAMEERPGAAHIELPEDVAREEIEDTQLFDVPRVRRPAPDRTSLQAAVEMIQKARMPLVLIGAGGNRKRTSKALTQFIEKTGIYFFNTQMGIGVVDERHPQFLGTAALSEHDYLHCAIERADLIVNVGHDVVEKPPFYMRHGGTRVIHINFNSAEVDAVYFPHLEVIGDIANTIEDLTELIKRQESWDFTYYSRIKVEVDQHLLKGSEDERYPVAPQRLVHDVRKVMPEDGIVSLDNGIYKIWFARNYKAFQPNTLLLDNALATMGAGFPVALAAKMVFPERKVLAVCGDGGFMMNSQELETAVRLGIDVVVLVLNDSAYGMIKWKQSAMGFDSYGMDYENPDFIKYAESYGAQGHRVNKTEELAATLAKCLASKGVHLIDLPIDYSENQKVLIEELQAKTCLL
ncbi:MAG: acetolactate synthase large subunit [Bdellovibrionales bacterium]|nr:acetolactate synthase large subunit [Bdellovibrionales bacterium]